MPGSQSTVEDLSSRYGFAIKSVCWGYRDLFARALEDLVDAGVIGESQHANTRTIFETLGHADQSCYDHVLKEFLVSLNARISWLLDLPSIFQEVVSLGVALSREKVYYGTSFFRILGAGGLGDTPSQVRQLVDLCQRLIQRDPGLALALARGYRSLIDRLTPDEISTYVEAGLTHFGGDLPAAISYLEVASRAAETMIASLTREARLSDMTPWMTRLVRAMSGLDVEIQDLGKLDSDVLIERGTRFVCMHRWCYLPVRCRSFAEAAANRDWYRLTAVVASGMLAARSFPLVHGLPGNRDIRELAGDDPARQNLVTVLEYARAIGWIRERWPGARRLLELGIATELTSAEGPAATLLRDLIARPGGHPDLRRIIRHSVNVYDTVLQISRTLVTTYRELRGSLLPAFAFLPDFGYPGEISTPASAHTVADLSREAAEAGRRRAMAAAVTDGSRGDSARGDREGQPDDAGDGLSDSSDDSPDRPAAAVFLYDEWSQEQNDYLPDHCALEERVPQESPGVPEVAMPDGVRKVQRAFERLKPALTAREKYQQDGDEIDIDQLHEFLVARHLEPSPEMRFYARPRVTRRDLAVLILLDTSGSTSQRHGSESVIDLERQAAMMLGAGLYALGDRFEIGGFSTTGPDRCDYSVYKRIDEPWDHQVRRRLAAARPANSTRIGVALRHAGYRMSRVPVRQRLIIAITDGKPMDAGYSAQTRYAQHDVRVACHENQRRGIHTFGISTEENTLADMEIMFPGRRFAILRTMEDLPRLLPGLYVRLTG